jgi:hypothetical protein
MWCATAAHGEVRAFFAADAACKPVTSLPFSIGKPVNLAVCMTSTKEAVCGYSLRLEAADAVGSGRFQITSRVLGKAYNDPTTGKLPPGLLVSLPASGPDLGATRDNPLAAAANQLLATLVLMPVPDMKQDAYVLRLAPNSVAGISSAVTCADATDAPLTAELTLRVAAKAAKH